MRVILIGLVGLATLLAGAASAQRSEDSGRVRTFVLQHLAPSEAARLVGPYVQSGSLFEAGGRINAITVRAEPAVMMRVESLLREYDRPPAVVVLHFQLIAADSTATRDAGIAGVEPALRELFRFAGYRLLTQTAATAMAREQFALKVAAGPERLDLKGGVSTVSSVGDAQSVRVSLELARPTGVYQGLVRSETLIATTLAIPIGETVVLGSAATYGGYQALILTVRPELKK